MPGHSSQGWEATKYGRMGVGWEDLRRKGDLVAPRTSHELLPSLSSPEGTKLLPAVISLAGVLIYSTFYVL